MPGYVLRVWAAGDTRLPPDTDPIRLETVDGSLVAAHGAGFDMQPFVCDGQPVDPSSALTTEGLRDGAMLEFVGDELWRRVAPEPIAAALAPELANALVYLDLRSAELYDYPWELLRCHDAFLFSRQQARICLGRPEARSGLFSPPPDLEHPLRVMVVIGNKTDDPNILADEELERIERRAHRENVDLLLKILFRPAPNQIQHTLKEFRPHVLHFVGHGNVDHENKPVVEVWSATANVNELWDAQKIEQEFSASPPRLVVLNACRTAAPTNAVSLMGAFARAGCPTVVGMMGDIFGEASVHFSHAFYDEVCAGATVDEAATRARRSLQNASGRDTPRIRSNWPLVRVLVHGDVDTVMKVPQPASNLVDFVERDFVDRWEQRWAAWHNMMETSRLTVFRGDSEAGKTELLKAIAGIWARNDQCVIHADVSTPPRGDWRDLLERVTAAASRAQGVDATVLSNASNAGNQSVNVYKAYRDALEQCSGGKPLLLVIDGLSEWDADLIALPELCAPYLRTEGTSHVRLIVALREAPDTGGWGGVPDGWRPIEVGQFPDHEWKRAVNQMAWYWSRQIADQNKADYFSNNFVPTILNYPETSARTLSKLRELAQI